MKLALSFSLSVVAVLAILTVSENASAYERSYYYKCQGRGNEAFRQFGKKSADATFMYYESKNEQGLISLIDFIGHAEVNAFASDYNDLLKNSSYYSQFGEDRIDQVLNYKPRKYKNHTRFDLTEKRSNGFDGGGMNGYLVLAPHAVGEAYEAHFVFQSGDHIGGTIDFTCHQI